MYRLMIAGSFIAGLSTATFILSKKKVPANIILMSIVLELILCMYLGLMSTFTLSKATGYGLTGTGGAIGILLGVYIFSNITPQYSSSFWEAYTLILPLMYGIGKIGCSFAGCCGGLPYNGIFHVTAKHGSAFPIQKLESIVFLLLFAISVVIYMRGFYDPVTAAMLYSLTKILLDFLRDVHMEYFISFNQILCTAVIVLLLMIKFNALGRIKALKNKYCD